MALFSTYIVWKFTTSGMPVWLAIVLAMAISFVGGALIERIVLRPVEQAPALVVVIVTIGMFLAINSLAELQFGSGQKALPSVYPQHTWRPGGVLVSSDTLVLVAVLGVECLLLYLLLQRTKLGLAFRGSRAIPRRAGCSASRSGGSSWSGGASPRPSARWRARLVIPTTPGLVPSSMQEILVFAFAAAALGGFDSVLGAVVGGMIVGVADALTTGYVHSLQGIDLVVPFGLILLVLLFRPAGLFGATTGGAGLMNRTQQRGFGLAAAVIAVVVVMWFFAWYFPQSYAPSDTRLVAEALFIGIAAMGLNVLTGYNGQVSIGHGAFFGVGAYVTVLLMDHQYHWLGVSFGHTSFIATLPVVAAVTFVIGALVGFPALRVKGLYLALVTLGLAVIFPDLATRFVKGTGGTSLVSLSPTEVAAPSWVGSRFGACPTSGPT